MWIHLTFHKCIIYSIGNAAIFEDEVKPREVTICKSSTSAKADFRKPFIRIAVPLQPPRGKEVDRPFQHNKKKTLNENQFHGKLIGAQY